MADRESKSIGEVAELFGLATSTLRFWEERGLIRPARRGASRAYSKADVRRVAMIVMCKEAGLRLAEIRAVAGPVGRKRRLPVLQAKLCELDERRAEIEAAREMVVEGMQCRARDPIDCPHFQPLLDARIARGPRG